MFLNLFIALLTFLIVYIIRWYQRNFNYWLRFKPLPSVPGRIFSGNILDFLTLKTHFGLHLKTIYDDPIFANAAAIGVYSLYKPTLLIRDPELLKSIFIRDFDCFSNRYAQPDLVSDPIGSLMLIFSKNPFWKKMRANLTPFFSSANLKKMYPLIQQVGHNLDDHLKSRGKRFVAEIKDICLLYTIDVSSTTIFGLHTNSLENPKEQINLEARRLVEFSASRALNHMCVFFTPHLCGSLGIRSFFKDTEIFLKATIDQVLQSREKTGIQRNDLIDIFLKLKQEALASGNDMKAFMNEIYAQAALFWIGGFETSSSAISHGLMELAMKPKLQERLRAEILHAFEEGNGDISYEAIGKLEYLDMVVHEVMRLYPLFTFLERKYEKPPHRQKSFTLEPFYDIELPEGTPIYISVYGLHYDEKYWPNPKKFDPERFASPNREKIHPMVYIPFGAGPRNCVGARLGMIQVKIGLMQFLKNHYVKVCPQTQTNPEFDPKAAIVQIKGGIYLEVIGDNMCDNRLRK
ncbi:cytochrome P450 6g1-like [Haematobia irritans]|uniref:cytochrome P450 6g1-like n=1 Tax=Haematobia irritans TaxID=7368 RepID=UPI003F4F4B4F